MSYYFVLRTSIILFQMNFILESSANEKKSRSIVVPSDGVWDADCCFKSDFTGH